MSRCCADCGRACSRGEFSGSQWKRGAASRCKACVGILLPDNPNEQQAAAAKQKADTAATLPSDSKAEARRPQFGGFADWLVKSCATCGKPASEGLQKCCRCAVIRYCSRECQLHAWKQLNHKRSCGTPLPTAAEFASADVERVITWIHEFHGAGTELAIACSQRLATAVVPSADPTRCIRAAAAGAGAFEALALVLQRYEVNIDVVGPTCVAIKHLCRDAPPAVKQRAVDAAIIEALVTVMHACHESSGLMEHAVGALSNLMESGRGFGPHVARAHAAGAVEVTVNLLQEHSASAGMGLVEGCMLLVYVADPSVSGPSKLASAGAIEVAVHLLNRHPRLCKLAHHAIEVLKHATLGTDSAAIRHKTIAACAGAIEATCCAMLTPIQMRASLDLQAHQAIEDSDEVHKSGAILLYNTYGFALAGCAGAFGTEIARGCEPLLADLAIRGDKVHPVLTAAAEQGALMCMPDVVDQCHKALTKVLRVVDLSPPHGVR